MKHGLRMLTAIVFLTSLAACSNEPSPGTNSTDAALELKVYSAGERDSADLARLLRRLLEGPAMEGTAEQLMLGRVQQLPSGGIAVLASASVHRDLDRLIERELEHESTAASAALRYWLVRATSADAKEIPRRLDAIRTALDELTEEMGPLRFDLVEQLRQHTEVRGESSQVMGSALNVNSTLKMIDDGRISADVRMRALDTRASFDTTATLTDGQTVLLAQTGSDEADALLLFVIRLDLD